MLRSDPFPAPLEIQLFGGARILIDGQVPKPQAPRKAIAVIARLTLAPRHQINRVSLANDVWPESDTDELRHFYLRRTLTTLRKLLGNYRDLVSQYSHDSLQIDLDNANIDLIAFDRAIASQDLARTEAAVRLYSGPLLAGFDEPWITHERLKRQSAYLAGVARLIQAARGQQDTRRVVDLCRLVVAVDPLAEPALRDLVEALADSGDIVGASAVYTKFERMLSKQHGLQPEPETRELYKRVSVGAWRNSRTESLEPPKREAVLFGDFPRPIQPILGRDLESHTLCAMVRANRLLTITAAGGFGKTRLSLHIAALMDGEFAGGNWFVDLSRITDPSLVLHAIMNQLGVKENPGVTPLLALKAHLQALPTLIILDNCEHLRDACASAALSLLTAASKLHILATSRQSLGISGEALFRLSPLASPNSTARSLERQDLDEWFEKFPAVSLFVQRARAQGVFDLTPGAMAAVMRICARLEGNALALELAAVQTRMYSAADLDRRLDSLFETLVTTSPTVLPRQRTLRALIGWSFDLLPQQEALLLARLSVFRGSWTLDSASAICSGEGIDPETVPTLISNLVDKSMVQTVVSDTGSLRFRLLEMVRIYSENRLQQHVDGSGDELNKTKSRSLEYFLEYSEGEMRRIRFKDQQAGLNSLELETDNIRSVLAFSIEAQLADSALRLCNSMWRYWFMRGHYSEGLGWFARSIELNGAGDSPHLGSAYIYAGNIAYNALRFAEARSYFEQYHDYAETLNDPALIASAQASIGLVLEGEEQYIEALKLFETASDALRNIGRTFLLAVCTSNIANIQAKLGDFNAAIGNYRSALQTLRTAPDTYDYVHPMVGYSGVLVSIGDIPEALSTLKEVLPQLFLLGSVNELQMALLVYVQIGVQREMYPEAACLLGVYSSSNDGRGLDPTPPDRRIYERCQSTTRAALGTRFQSSFDRGYSLAPDLVEDYIRSLFH